MAFASVGTLGSGQSKASGTSVSLTTGANAEAGNLVVVLTAWDNTATADGDSTNIDSITDSAGGNTWTKVAEYTETEGGAAADGVTLAIFYSVLTNQINSGGTITANADTARTAKAITAWEFTKGAGTTVEVDTGSIQKVGAASSDPANQTISGLTSREYLFVQAFGQEQSTATSTYTKDTNYTGFTQNGSSGGGGASNMLVAGGFRILTGTGDSANPATSSDTNEHVQIYVALYEQSGGTTETPTPGGGIAAGSAPVAFVTAIIAGAIAAGTALTAQTPVAAGGAGAGGASPTPVALVTPGGAPAAGLGTIGALVGVSTGGATAGGYAPTESTAVTETPTPGGALAAGLGPGALVSVSSGGAIASGVAPTESSAVTETPTPGGAIAGGAGPTAAIVAAQGGSSATGFEPVAHVAVTPGGAVSVSGGAGALVTLTIQGAIAAGNQPVESFPGAAVYVLPFDRPAPYGERPTRVGASTFDRPGARV